MQANNIIYDIYIPQNSAADAAFATHNKRKFFKFIFFSNALAFPCLRLKLTITDTDSHDEALAQAFPS